MTGQKRVTGHKKRWPVLLAFVCLTQGAVGQTTVVDALVRGKNGKVVSNLGAGDFRLWEDGKEQPITSFSMEEAGQAEPLYVAFLFDTAASVSALARGTAEKSARRQEVADFAGAYAGPDRYMAVMNFNGALTIAQDFTTLADRVQQAAGAVPSGSAERAKAVAAVKEANEAAAMGSTVPVTALMNSMAAMTGNRWNAIRTIANSMAAMKGHKFLVIFGASHALAFFELPPALAQDCNRAKVSVYTTNPDFKGLAEATGGRLIGKNLARELGEMVEDRDKGYALGFQPAELADGNCHSLRVDVPGKGLEVQARGSYCNEKAADLLAGKAQGAALEASVGGAAAGNAAASMEVPYFYSSPGVALVDLAMQMDLGRLKFTKQKNGKLHAELDLVGVAYGADGGVVTKFSDAVSLDFETPAEAESVRDYPYRYERQFRLPAGRYNVRVAFGSGGENFGKAEAPLTIDPWDGQRLTLSAIALARGAHKVPDLTSDLDPSLLEGHKDLIAKSIEVYPSGSNNFRDSEPCIGYLEIQDPLLAGPNPPSYSIGVRVLDRRTGEEKAGGWFEAADYIRPGIAVTPVLINVPIEGLARGSYALEAKVLRSPEDDSAVRTVEFQIGEGDAEAAGSQPGEAMSGLADSLPPLIPAKAPALPGSLPPPGSEQELLLASARQAALDYASRLPNFLCTQTVRRSADHGRGFSPVDTLTVEVGYYEGQDRYRLTEVDSAPAHTQYGDQRGTISQGEFGSNLRKIFDPAAAADFRFVRWTTLNGRRAAAYSYRVERSKARYQIMAGVNDKVMLEQVGLRGEVIIDRETSGILRLNYMADAIPQGFAIRRTNVTVDYGEVGIGDKRYPLPLKATVELQDKSGISRNEVSFHSYRQFSSDSRLNFGEEEPKQQP
jgi:VWFA-related protein